MASPKDDASTDIEGLTKSFAVDMTAECAALRKARIELNKKAADKSAKDKKDEKKKDDKKSADPPVCATAVDRRLTHSKARQRVALTIAQTTQP